MAGRKNALTDWQSERMGPNDRMRGGVNSEYELQSWDAKAPLDLPPGRPSQGKIPRDWPPEPMRGDDGTMYGPGYAADPTGGTDSSPAKSLYENSWLDNVVKLADAGMLHPQVLKMLEPQIRALQRSQAGRGKQYD